MTTVLFKPGTSEEFGEFKLSVASCVGYLETQVKAYGLTADSQLGDWFKDAKQGALIPELFCERARYMVADLMENGAAVNVYCRQCGNEVSSEFLLKQSWDESHVEHGIRVGTAGYQITCNKEHTLLVVCERVY
ncbi:hypothetical protein GC197_03190 [bacterium]|nr:hypothetical protein [bacterium]